MQMCMADLLVTAQNFKQATCPPTTEWVNKWCHIHTTEPYWHKRNKLLVQLHIVWVPFM